MSRKRFYFEAEDLDGNGLQLDPALRFRLNSCDWHCFGGPKEASLTVFGPAKRLWELLEWLRYPMEIRTFRSERFWWGYVHEATVREGSTEVGMSLDDMYNRVRVEYSYIPTGSNEVGERKLTDWVQDDESVDLYGRKELIHSTDGATDALALARRAAVLGARKYPQGLFDHVGWGMPGGTVGDSGAEASMSATLKLRGWWKTLGWRYASTPPVTGIDNGVWDGDGTYQMGRSTWSKYCQQFTTGATAPTVREITISASRVGTPTDNLRVSVYALDGSGNPTGSALASETYTGSDLEETYSPGGYNLITYVLGSGLSLSASTQYGLVVDRTGAVDANNFYRINVDTGSSYAGGILKAYWLFTTPGWYGLATVGLATADMPFILWADDYVGTGRQMADMVEQYGDFISQTYFEDASTTAQSTFLDGTKTLLEELELVMDAGGANNRRMLGWVDWDQILRFYEEPANTNIAYWIDKQGILLNQWLAPLGLGELYRVPGRYVEVVDVIPDSVDLTRLIDPRIQFVEGVKWTRNGGVRPQFRGQKRIEDVLRGVSNEN
jgi:hypothetical protein